MFGAATAVEAVVWVWSLVKLLKLLYVGVVNNDTMRTIISVAKWHGL